MEERVKFSLSRQEVQKLVWLMEKSKLDPSKFSPSPFRANFDEYKETREDFQMFFTNILKTKKIVEALS